MDDFKDKILSNKEAKEQIRKWKDQYQSVYMSEINNVHFIWRGLTRAEYKKALELYEDDYERAEYVCTLCVLDPIKVDYSNEIYAGIPETLAANILRESGFTEDESKITQLLQQYEEDMNRFDNQISCIIAEIFPYHTIDEIENWSLEKTLWYYARAKWILKTLRGVELVSEEQSTPNGLPPDFPIAPNKK